MLRLLYFVGAHLVLMRLFIAAAPTLLQSLYGSAVPYLAKGVFLLSFGLCGAVPLSFDLFGMDMRASWKHGLQEWKRMVSLPLCLYRQLVLGSWQLGSQLMSALGGRILVVIVFDVFGSTWALALNFVQVKCQTLL